MNSNMTDTDKLTTMHKSLEHTDDIRKNNRVLNISEFQRGEIELRSLPVALFIELTQNCNLSCPYCRSGLQYDPALNMSLPLFRQVAEELFPLASLVDLRGWGESTILKSFKEMVSIATAYGPQIRLVTNAMNPDESIWDQLMAHSAMVAISCDSADPHLFAQLRAGGDLQRLCTTVKTITRLRDQYRVPTDHVYFTTVVSLPNVKNLSQLVQMACDLGLTKLILFPIGIEPSHPWHLRHDLEATRKGLIDAHETANDLGITLQLGAALDDSLCLIEDVKTLCMHPWAYATIDYAGRVGFCDHLVGNSRHTFGSLTKKKFGEIWNGEEFKLLRATHLSKSFPDRFSPCRWCHKMRYVDFEDIMYPTYSELVVSNRTRPQLYEQGAPIVPVPEFY